MSFQPIIPISGLSGWIFLNRTLASQLSTHDASPALSRDTDYFEATIGSVETAEQLVSDRRLMRVALGAFGLQDDLDNRFFIRKVLEEGTSDPKALANRLTDNRYRKLADAFGFDRAEGPHIIDSGFGHEIVQKYRRQSFEVAVGQQDESMRLAMSAQRQLEELLASGGSEETKWYTILGTPPLRKVFEKALGFPSGIANIDIDKQLEMFRERARSQLALDSLTDLADADVREGVLRKFLLRDQMSSFGSSAPGSVALTLLRMAASPT